MMGSAGSRGRAFEDLVAELLELLRHAYPDRVAVTRQPKIQLHDKSVVRPDFELIVALPHQRDRRLIECQDRRRPSQGIARKIRVMKSMSEWNRVIFVYRDPTFLSKPLAASLKANAVPHYSLIEFADYLRRMSTTLASTTSPPFKDVDYLARAADLLVTSSLPSSSELKLTERTPSSVASQKAPTGQPGLDLELLTREKHAEFLGSLTAFVAEREELGEIFLRELAEGTVKFQPKDEAMLARPTKFHGPRFGRS